MMNMPAVKHKRRMFVINLYGVTSNEDYSVQVTQDTTAQDAIQQALTQAGKNDEKVDDYVIMEDVSRGWEKDDLDKMGSLRILDAGERILLAQNRWKGHGKFILRKKSDDPSTRAWLSTLAREHKGRGESSCSELTTPDWESPEPTFLVCIHNVSHDQPHTILQAPVSSTVQDVITQAMMKARRPGDPRNFVLMEDASRSSGEHKHRGSFRKTESRILRDDENVYQVQSQWKNNPGMMLVLKERDKEEKKKKSSKNPLQKLNQMLAKDRKEKVNKADPEGPMTVWVRRCYTWSGRRIHNAKLKIEKRHSLPNSVMRIVNSSPETKRALEPRLLSVRKIAEHQSGWETSERGAESHRIDARKYNKPVRISTGRGDEASVGNAASYSAFPQAHQMSAPISLPQVMVDDLPAKIMRDQCQIVKVAEGTLTSNLTATPESKTLKSTNLASPTKVQTSPTDLNPTNGYRSSSPLATSSSKTNPQHVNVTVNSSSAKGVTETPSPPSPPSQLNQTTSKATQKDSAQLSFLKATSVNLDVLKSRYKLPSPIKPAGERPLTPILARTKGHVSVCTANTAADSDPHLKTSTPIAMVSHFTDHYTPDNNTQTTSSNSTASTGNDTSRSLDSAEPNGDAINRNGTALLRYDKRRYGVVDLAPLDLNESEEDAADETRSSTNPPAPLDELNNNINKVRDQNTLSLDRRHFSKHQTITSQKVSPVMKAINQHRNSLTSRTLDHKGFFGSSLDSDSDETTSTDSDEFEDMDSSDSEGLPVNKEPILWGSDLHLDQLFNYEEDDLNLPTPGSTIIDISKVTMADFKEPLNESLGFKADTGIDETDSIRDEPEIDLTKTENITAAQTLARSNSSEEYKTLVSLIETGNYTTVSVDLTKCAIETWNIVDNRLLIKLKHNVQNKKVSIPKDDENEVGRELLVLEDYDLNKSGDTVPSADASTNGLLEVSHVLKQQLVDDSENIDNSLTDCPIHCKQHSVEENQRLKSLKGAENIKESSDKVEPSEPKTSTEETLNKSRKYVVTIQIEPETAEVHEWELVSPQEVTPMYVTPVWQSCDPLEDDAVKDQSFPDYSNLAGQMSSEASQAGLKCEYLSPEPDSVISKASKVSGGFEVSQEDIKCDSHSVDLRNSSFMESVDEDELATLLPPYSQLPMTINELDETHPLRSYRRTDLSLSIRTPSPKSPLRSPIRAKSPFSPNSPYGQSSPQSPLSPKLKGRKTKASASWSDFNILLSESNNHDLHHSLSQCNLRKGKPLLKRTFSFSSLPASPTSRPKSKRVVASFRRRGRPVQICTPIKIRKQNSEEGYDVVQSTRL